MRIRLRSPQTVVTIAALALPALHLAGQKHHHPGGSQPAQTRTAAGNPASTGTTSAGTTSTGTTSTGTTSTGTTSAGTTSAGTSSTGTISTGTTTTGTTSAGTTSTATTGTSATSTSTTPSGQPSTSRSQTSTPQRVGTGQQQAGHQSANAHHHFNVPLALKAHSARDPGDTISDFKFSPASLTVHVGDAVTWTNVGPAQHTATASDHSFDTGILGRGASASHTFSTAGTFAYICTIHPFMHGTVVVLASTTTSTPSTTPSTTPGATTPTTTPTSSAGGLPNTGLDLAATVLIGLLLGGAGLLLRRPACGAPQSESGKSRTPDR